MALMTFREVRDSLMEQSPEQWPTMLNSARMQIDRGDAPFSTLLEFVTGKVGNGGLGMTVEQVKPLLYFNPAYTHIADTLSKRLGIVELAKRTSAVAEHGENQHTGDNKTKNVISTQGNSSKYRIAKLKRDYPDVAKRLEAGEFKSVSAAERAVGIGKPLMTPVEKIIKAIGKLTEEEFDQLKKALENEKL